MERSEEEVERHEESEVSAERLRQAYGNSTADFLDGIDAQYAEDVIEVTEHLLVFLDKNRHLGRRQARNALVGLALEAADSVFLGDNPPD